MTNTRTLWISLAALLVASFAVLLAMGGEIYRKAPPLPDRVVAEDGSLIYDGAEIQRGRQVWQSIGGMQLGSIWGHGGYVAPDWSADWLHREALAVLDLWAQREAQAATYGDLPSEQRAALRGRLETRMRANTYDPATRTITLDADRAEAIARVARALPEPVRQRPRHGRAARGVRHEKRHGACRGAPTRAHRIRLVDRMGGGHEST